ncbi:MAG: hypothetical protein ACXWCG_10285 [Flavitalea sp.]
MKTIILAAFLMIATGGVLSAQTTKGGNCIPGRNTNNPGYVDANKNDTCDNYENNTRALARKGQGQNIGRGTGFSKGNGQCRSAMQGRKTGNGKRGPKSLVN